MVALATLLSSASGGCGRGSAKREYWVAGIIESEKGEEDAKEDLEQILSKNKKDQP